MKKKIGYIFLLLIIILAIVLFFVFKGSIKIEKNDNNQVLGSRSIDDSNNKIIDKNNSNKNTVKEELQEGTLYSLSNDKIKADIVLGDNYYDTQIKDIMYNFDSYKGKTIEIEGMFLDMNPYTVVGRYSTSALCPYCPAGYSAIEYVWDGDKIELKDKDSWIKVIGTLCVGNDETSDYQDYYYIQALSIEVMNERGIDTVSN